jgi:hypothetical protein
MKVTIRSVLAVLVLLGVTGAQAYAGNARTLYCDGGNVTFTATLLRDPSGPGYFDLKNAELYGAYVKSDLICAGDTKITGVACTGFLHSSRSAQINIGFQVVGNRLFLIYAPDQPRISRINGPWACSVK